MSRYSFLTETWLYRNIFALEVFSLRINYPVTARQDRYIGEHSEILLARKKAFDLYHSQVKTLNDNSVAISALAKEGSNLFLIMRNLPSKSPHRIQTDELGACIATCHKLFQCQPTDSFTVSCYLNVEDVNLGYYDCQICQILTHSCDRLAVAETPNLCPLVFEYTHLSGNTLDVILATSSDFLTVRGWEFILRPLSCIHSVHYPITSD